MNRETDKALTNPVGSWNLEECVLRTGRDVRPSKRDDVVLRLAVLAGALGAALIGVVMVVAGGVLG